MITPPSNIPLTDLKGNVLIADPSLRDGTFNKSVIYLIDHSRQHGSSGLILNHPTGKSVGDLISSQQFHPLKDIPVHHGGPVASDQLSLVSFHWTSNGRLRCQPQLSAEQATALLGKQGFSVRAFIGYAEWAPQQLPDEIEANAWFSTYVTPEIIESPQQLTLWNQVLTGMSPYHKVISMTPDNPFLN